MKTEPNDSAYPVSLSGATKGLTKREYFAAKAMQGLIASREPYKGKDLTQTAVKKADQLIEALNDSKQNE